MHIFGNPTIKHAELPWLYPNLKLWIDARPPFTMPATTNNANFVNIINRANKNVPAWSTITSATCVFNSFRNNIQGIAFPTSGANFDFNNPSITFGTNSTVIACCIPKNTNINSVLENSSGNGSWFGINTSLQPFVGDNAGTNAFFTATGTVANGQVCTFAAVVVSSTSTRLYINGVLDSTSGTGPFWATNGCNVIGNSITGAAATNDMILAEYIYINALVSDQDIYLFHKYLQNKWF